jgi:hypothetical protein
MSKFHIHKDEQQQGPFTLDELRDLKITRETMVWFEGEDNWKPAVEIEELKEIFKSIPPPMVATKNEDETKPASEVNSPSKNNGVILVVLAVLLISGLGYFIFTSQQAKEVEMLRQIEEQKIKIQELEDIKADRLAEEEKAKINAIASQRQLELESLYFELNQAITNLRAAEIRLNEIQEFRLLRTPSKKQQQIQQQLEYIMAWENEVGRLKMEIDKTRNS